MKLSAVTLFTTLATAAAFAPAPMGVRSASQLDARKPFITGNWKLNPQ